MNRKKVVLSILLSLLVLAIVYSFWRMPRQKSVAVLKFSPGARARAGSTLFSKNSGETAVHLDLLKRPVGEFSGFRRNIFAPIFQEKREAPPLPRVKKTKRAVLPPPLPVLQPPPVQRELAQFTFLGFLQKGNKKTIFLTSNNEIFLVKKGDTILGKYEIAGITDEVLTIRPRDNGGEIIIPLMENRPLSFAGQ